MRKINKIYDYFFYKMYKWVEYTSELGGGRFWSDWKASLSMDGIIYFIIISLFIYCKVIFGYTIDINFDNRYVLILVIPVALFNYFVFNHNDRWRRIISTFDELPSKKNVIGGWIVLGIILMIISNLIFSYYLLFSQAKTNQVGPYAPEVVKKERREDSLQKAQQIEKLKKIYGEDKKGK
ncbi:hypothetical protein VUJ46_02550 [Chryseobacterium sp. MYb264]|uniref:hypothetical protein n=1 Tax=Chryseobacterium sp. MYb264 TaxID=2745153 RepID=UPI002E0EEAFA|nr:hypothetical protein VUJ46_02550 [Chryseobacterium sp. MYb264]